MLSGILGAFALMVVIFGVWVIVCAVTNTSVFPARRPGSRRLRERPRCKAGRRFLLWTFCCRHGKWEFESKSRRANSRRHHGHSRHHDKRRNRR